MLVRMPVDITWPYGGGSPGASIFHLRCPDLEPYTEVLGDLSEIVRQFYAAMDDLYVDSVRLKFAGLLTGVGSDKGKAVEIDPWEVAGTAAVGPLPPSNQIVVGWKTSSATRSGRGRTFVGPLQYAVVDDAGSPAAPVLSVVRNAAAALVTAQGLLTEGGIGVWSTKQSLFRDFTGSTVRDTFAVLRSRRD